MRKKESAMDWFHRQLAVWKEPLLVWKFQKLFGVERVRVESNGKTSDDYLAVDYDEWLMKNGGYDPRAVEDKDDVTGGSGGDSIAARLRKRKLSSSGYSSASCEHVRDEIQPLISHDRLHQLASSDSQERSESEMSTSAAAPTAAGRKSSRQQSDNLVFYRINSAFWYWVFFLGTQLGDETYYSIFFSVWFWNIDGAVGRRVMMVWCLVMYLGRTMKATLHSPCVCAALDIYFRPRHEGRDPVAAAVDAPRGAPRAEVDPRVRHAVHALNGRPGGTLEHSLLHIRKISGTYSGDYGYPITHISLLNHLYVILK